MADAPVLPPVTAETVEAHMSEWHVAWPNARDPIAHTGMHSLDGMMTSRAVPDGKPNGHTHAADEGTTE